MGIGTNAFTLYSGLMVLLLAWEGTKLSSIWWKELEEELEEFGGNHI